MADERRGGELGGERNDQEVPNGAKYFLEKAHAARIG